MIAFLRSIKQSNDANKMFKQGLRVVNQSQFKFSNPYSTLRKTSFWNTKFTDSMSCKAVHYCKIYLVKAYQNWKEPQSCVEWLIFCPFWCQWHFCHWLQLHPNFFPSTFCTWTDTFFWRKLSILWQTVRWQSLWLGFMLEGNFVQWRLFYTMGILYLTAKKLYNKI